MQTFSLNQVKKVLLIGVLASALVSSVITYYFTKTNYQEQYYAQQLEQNKLQKEAFDKMNTLKNYKPDFTTGRAY